MVWGPNGCDPLEPRIDPGTPYHEGTEAMASMTIKQFIVKHNVRMTATWVDSVPHRDMDDDWNRTASHYRCVIRHEGKSMTVYYSMGAAHTSEPKLKDVLDSVASDSRGVIDQGFEDWAGDYGMDSDSIKAWKTYRLCRKQAAKLAKLLGPDAYAELLACEPE
jgi:hypothetical protein